MSLNVRMLLRRVNTRLCLYVFCVLLPFLLSPLAASPQQESKCAYVMILVAGYWLLEPVPVAVTALIPVVLFPLLGVVSSVEICSNYMKESFMMFIGGLIVAVAVEDSKLHERIALKVLLLVGSEIKWLMLGFMVTTMFLSMWVSNTATTAMMLPIVEAIVDKISNKSEDIEMAKTDSDSKCKGNKAEDGEIKVGNSTKTNENEDVVNSTTTVKLALLLSICYSANIGGTGTLTGTGPNLVLKGLMEELYPDSEDITFATWMMYNVPGMLLCILISWVYLWMVYIRFSKSSHNLQSRDNIRRIISERYAGLGSISIHEAQVIILFAILVFLWIFRDPKFISGWSEAIGSGSKMVGDSVPAMIVAFFLFFLPADPRDPGGKPILEWKKAQEKLPWGVIILLGGGFALADAAKKSGLSQLLGYKLSSLETLSPVAIVAIMGFMTAMLTEIMSNTTTATILLPVFNQMAISVGVNPLFLMLPITVVCSYAFMLPVATPPNAIAFDSGKMKTLDMAKPGLFMNIVCCSVQLLMINTLGVAMFDLYNPPPWLTVSNTAGFTNSTSELNMTYTDSMFNIPSNINATWTRK